MICRGSWTTISVHEKKVPRKRSRLLTVTAAGLSDWVDGLKVLPTIVKLRERIETIKKART